MTSSITSEPADISRVEVEGVSTVTIHRAEYRNALDRDSVAALIAALEASASSRCVVVRSDGSSFCSGGGLQHLERLASQPELIRSSIEGSFQRLIRTIRGLPVPVIARVQGPAVGAGADLALACDIRVASDQAWIKEAWIELGLVSALGAPVNLAMQGGPGFALDVLLLGRHVEAPECLARGLFQYVVPEAELDEEVGRVAQVIATRDPDGVRAMKELVAATFADAFDEGLRKGVDKQERLMRSPFFVQRVRAILSRISKS